MIKKFVEKFVEKFLCKHEWVVHYTTEIYEKGYKMPISGSAAGTGRSDPGSDSQFPAKRRRTFICNKCGKIKTVIL